MDGNLTVIEPEAAALIDYGDAHLLGGQLAQRREYRLLPAPIEELRTAASIIANSPMVNPNIQGDEKACLAIAYQAALWEFDPVAVGSKAYLTPVKGGGMKLAYEAQLVHALILARAPLSKRPKITLHGVGSQRFCTVIYTVRGQRDPLDPVSSPVIGTIKPKNSPLWFSDPDQQLIYYTCRSGARRHFPDVIMGVYTPDELATEGSVHDRPDPYADDVETVAVIEPSGGEGWKAGDAGQRDAREDEQQPRGRQQERPAPSGGGEKQEPPDMAAIRERVAAAQADILKMEGRMAGVAAWEALIVTKDWKRLKAYDQALTTTIKGAIFAHLDKLKAPNA